MTFCALFVSQKYMLNGLKINKQESYWSSNLRGLFKVFLNKATATKYCFQVFQFFFNEFIDCIDEPYIIAGLRALASHHALLLKNKKLWYHTIRTAENEDIKLTWKMLFDEFRRNLHIYIEGRMFFVLCFGFFVQMPICCVFVRM